MSFLARWIVYACYRLEDSRSYNRFKTFVYNLMENPTSAKKVWFDAIMITLVLLSVFFLIYEVRNPSGPFVTAFEAFVVTVFIIEYLLRLWIYNDTRKLIIEMYEEAEFLHEPFRFWPVVKAVVKKKLEYMTTPLAIIDLLAILPSYRPLRMLRIFLLFRLFKLFRYTNSVVEFVKVFSEKRFEFLTLVVFIILVTFFSGTAIYMFEADVEESAINTFFDAMYWSVVTISTVGYGDITPTTTEGRFIAMILIVSGITVISFSTSIVVSAFTEKMETLQESRFFSDVERMRDYVVICGFGRVGEVVAKKLAEEKAKFIVVEVDEDRVLQAQKRGYKAVRGDGSRTELLENLGVAERARAVVCTTADDTVNLFITLTARNLSKKVTIIARAKRRESRKKLKLAGADHIVAPYEVAGLMGAEYVGQPVAFEALHGIFSGEKGVILDALVIEKGSFLDGMKIGEIDFRRAKLVLFGIIKYSEAYSCDATGCFQLSSNRFVFNPSEEQTVEGGDILVVFGHRVSIVHLKDKMERSALHHG